MIVMPNAGQPHLVDERLIYLATPENFGVIAKRFYKAGVKLVGGCCGTKPDHIVRVSAAARMVAPRYSAKTSGSRDLQAKALAPIPLAKCSRLGASLGNRFLISVEVNPGIGLETSKQVAAARMLYAAGADVINIADGPRATARMSNLALAWAIKEQLQQEVLLHVCCRDENLLGLQAKLLGAHTMGFHNLVVITGDPPKIGDYPDATAVYDLDSIRLLQLIRQYNCGLDAGEKSLHGQTHFVLATGAEPAASDFTREITRLRQKIAAGAHVVMTQPVYSPEPLERFISATKDLNIPIFVGILPLANSKNAEFLHQHVPGMQIPESIRLRMRKAGSGKDAQKEGILIAQETLLAVRNRVAGAYIMPPLERYEMAAEIIAILGPDRSVAQGIPGRTDLLKT